MCERLKEAEPLLRKALEISIALYSEKHIFVAIACTNLSLICTLSNRLVEGENMLLRAIEITKELPNQHQRLADLKLALKQNREMQKAQRQ